MEPHHAADEYKTEVNMQMKWRASGIAFLVLLPSGSRACGPGPQMDRAAFTWEDLPSPTARPIAFSPSALGALRATRHLEDLVVAFRSLAGNPLTEEETGAFTADSIFASAENAAQTWLEERARIPDVTSAQVHPTRDVDYGSFANCLPDAFHRAVRTLADRARLWGKESPWTRAWVAQQDAVFQACDGSSEPSPALPPLPADAPLQLRHDYAYQDAALTFYSLDNGRAAEMFAAIGQDATAPDRWLAQYLELRALVRAASAPDAPELAEALRKSKAILASRDAKSVHKMVERYQSVILARKGERSELVRTLGVSLAAPGFGSAFPEALSTYVDAFSSKGAPLPPDDSDRLTTFLRIVQASDVAAFEKATALWKKTRSPAWLAAALVTSPAPCTADACKSLWKESEKAGHTPDLAATYAFHKARLAGYDLKALTPAEARALGKDGENLLRREALSRKREAADLLALSWGQPLAFKSADGNRDDTELLNENEAAPPPEFFPEFIAFWNDKVSVPRGAALLAKAEGLPLALQARLAGTLWVRAVLLQKWDDAKALLDLIAPAEPAFAKRVRTLSPTLQGDTLRFAALYEILKRPQLAPRLPFLSAGLFREAALDHIYPETWCTLQSPPSEHSPLLSEEPIHSEWKELATAQSGVLYLARELSGLAAALPPRDEMAEALALAVVATRYQRCGGDTETTAASKAVFQVLHKRFPKSRWAKETKYFY